MLILKLVKGNGKRRKRHQRIAVEVPDPVFRSHMQGLVGHQIIVSVGGKSLTGTLNNVFEDHLLVTANGARHHIRLDRIEFVQEISNNNS